MSPAQFSGFSPRGIQSVGLGIQSVGSGIGRSTGMAWGGASGAGWAGEIGWAVAGGLVRRGTRAVPRAVRAASTSVPGSCAETPRTDPNAPTATHPRTRTVANVRIGDSFAPTE